MIGTCRLHQLLLGTFRADDVIAVSDEASPHKRGLTGSTAEAVVVPVAILEGDKPGATDTYTESMHLQLIRFAYQYFTYQLK